MENIITIIPMTDWNREQIFKCAQLYCRIWQEPPWNEDFWTVEEVTSNIINQTEKQNFIGVMVFDEMKQVIGFGWGHEVLLEELYNISKIKELDYIFENGRVFYIDELGVNSSNRSKGIGERILQTLIKSTQQIGIRNIVLQTAKKAESARKLYIKIGFIDLEIENATHSDRTYWHLSSTFQNTPQLCCGDEPSQ